MKNNATPTPENKTRAFLVLLVALTTIGAVSFAAQADHDPAVAHVTVNFHEDDMGFDVTSTKGLSNIIVQLCPPGETHKHEEPLDEEDLKNWTHRENHEIVAIWVKSGNNHNPDGTAPPSPFDTPGAGEYFPNEGVDCQLPPPPPPEPECVGPSNVTALALPDGDIFVDWDGVNGEDGYNVYRHDGDGNFSLLTHVEAPTTDYLDNDTVVGATYTYTVTATTEGQESEACEEASATAIPVFPTFVAAGMAVFASLGAYGFLRRRD